ncbi:hypothetical protein LY90DRAFT_508082 [Neocallimastix californiae]|uniref:N-acetyltransferase domain-containing protein n=1 Tax=Neocallimastix californiae TaxID=1754190 RepID=A0A1Y2D0C0_9FUNG|nr:hypothetical protein LY90DRAFT_508082 [Neocallimastix californiae]|eukprot:ORY52731.1 hypothetical protein LY90DRAFT_508082 [Neocallimastix californiae]
MNEITFRRVRKDELEKCLDILYEAFKDYSIYHIIIPNSEANHGKFNRALLSCQLADSMANGIVMVAEREGEIISVIQLHSPEYKETTVFQYLFLGAFTVFRYGGIRKSLSFINMVNQCYSTNVEYAKNNPNCWDLECLAVKKKYQGQGIGSQVIQECIIPYVKKEGELLIFKT